MNIENGLMGVIAFININNMLTETNKQKIREGKSMHMERELSNQFPN